MKIDTTKIPNFDALPDEAKTAILDMEFADVPDMSQYVTKAVFDRKASEAADLNKQLKSRMSEDEAKKAKEDEERAALLARVEELEAERTFNANYTAYLSMGYDEKLAKSSANALTKGDMATVFANQKAHLENREKDLRTELLKQTPTPPAGGTDTGIKKEEFAKMSLADKQKFAAENPETYASFYEK